MSPLRRLRQHNRGSTLIVVTVLLLALFVIGAGVMLRSTKAHANASAQQHYESTLSCADAARALLMSQFRTFGVSITSLQLNTTVGTYQLSSGHYDQVNVQTVKSLSGTGTFVNQTAVGLSNRTVNVQLGGAPYLFTVVCSDTTGQARQTEVEFLIRFGL